MRSCCMRRSAFSPCNAHARRTRKRHAVRCTAEQLQQAYPFITAFTEYVLSQFTSQKSVDDNGIDVALAAHRRSIAQPSGDELQRLFQFFLGFTRSTEMLARERFQNFGSGVPSSEIFCGKRIARDLT